MPTNANLLPDVELLARDFLAGRSAVTDLVGSDSNGQPRIYTRNPATGPPSGRYVLLRRLPTAPVGRRPLWLDAAVVQFDCYGGTQRQANRLAETVRRELDAMADAATSHAEGVVVAVEHGGLGYMPDADQLTARDNARERYIVTATVYAHPER